MSGVLLRLVCSAAVAAGTALAPMPAAAAPDPPAASERGAAGLLTELQRLYREAERATEAYHATEERLERQRALAERLQAALARTRNSLHDSRSAAGRLARQQYQNRSDLSPYLRLLLARDAQGVLDQGQVIGRLARQRARAVGRLTGEAQKATELARRARKALDTQRALTERSRKQRDQVRERLREVEELIASLSPEEVAAVEKLERAEADAEQQRLVTSDALPVPGTAPAPTAAGAQAVSYAVRQVGKPYQWGAEGPGTYDCSGLTSQAWEAAGTPVPRTSQEQWARLERIPLKRLRPGDLVVYFPDATHVALYVGGGKVVQAPRPGARIKVSPVAGPGPVLGAVRPDPAGKPLRHYQPPELPGRAMAGPDAGRAQAPAASATSLR